MHNGVLRDIKFRTLRKAFLFYIYYYDISVGFDNIISTTVKNKMLVCCTIGTYLLSNQSLYPQIFQTTVEAFLKALRASYCTLQVSDFTNHIPSFQSHTCMFLKLPTFRRLRTWALDLNPGCWANPERFNAEATFYPFYLFSKLFLHNIQVRQSDANQDTKQKNMS